MRTRELEVGSEGSGVRMETDDWEVVCQNYSVTGLSVSVACKLVSEHYFQSV